MGLKVEAMAGLLCWAPGWPRRLGSLPAPTPQLYPTPSGNKWSWCSSTHLCTLRPPRLGRGNCHKNSSFAVRGMWGERRLSAIPLPAGPASVLLLPPGCISRRLKHHQTPHPL